jgi:hypothetical protein
MGTLYNCFLLLFEHFSNKLATKKNCVIRTLHLSLIETEEQKAVFTKALKAVFLPEPNSPWLFTNPEPVKMKKPSEYATNLLGQLIEVACKECCFWPK